MGSIPIPATTALGIGPIVDARTLSLTKRIIRTKQGGILYLLTSPSGEIGRHKGLKIPRHYGVPVRVRRWGPKGCVHELVKSLLETITLVFRFC